MKRFETCAPPTAATLIMVLCLALAIPRPAVAHAVKAFPMAEGSGASATGGRVIEVVNLVDQAQYEARVRHPSRSAVGEVDRPIHDT